jgi:hypothetical protein
MKAEEKKRQPPFVEKLLWQKPKTRLKFGETENRQDRFAI